MNDIADEINRQIGSRAFFMMGTKNKLSHGDVLIFDVKCRGSKANKVKVELMPSDTYTVTFYKVRAMAVRVVAVVEDVYVDSLHRVIESNTGLALSL